jgi:uncharacterized OsmC-like protein
LKNAEIGDAISAAVEYLGKHPDEARYTDSVATAVLANGLAVTVSGPDGASVETDMPKSVGGGGGAPSPGWFLRAAQASCVAMLIAIAAARDGVELGRIEVSVDSESDDRGILGIDDTVPAGPLSSRTRVRVEAGGVARQDIERLVHWADAHCPVQDAVRRAIPCTLEVT